MGGLVVKKDEPSWIRYIRQRIKKNKNFLCFISGQTGSGKSWCSLSIAEQLDDEFDIERCVFRGKELMDIINSGKLKKGSVIVFEEAGIEMSSRNWQSTTNKMLNFLIQTFRHRNFILLFNSPYMDFVDASTRRLFHAELQTIGINIKERKVKLKPQLIQYNSRNQKFYYKMLRVATKKGVYPVKSWSVIQPSKQLIEEYEKKKRAFTDALNKEIYEELDGVKKNKHKELTPKQESILMDLEKGQLIQEIADKRNIGIQSVYKQIELIKRKDVIIKPVKSGQEVIRYEVSMVDN